MVSALVSGLSGPGSSPPWPGTLPFVLGQTLKSDSASLHSGGSMRTSEFNAASNLEHWKKY